MFRKLCNKFSLAVAVCLGSFASFAEGASFTVDTTAASSAVNTIVEGIKTWITTITPYILGLVGAGLVIWLIFVGVKLVRAGGNKAIKA